MVLAATCQAIISRELSKGLMENARWSYAAFSGHRQPGISDLQLKFRKKINK